MPLLNALHGQDSQSREVAGQADRDHDLAECLFIRIVEDVEILLVNLVALDDSPLDAHGDGQSQLSQQKVLAPGLSNYTILGKWLRSVEFA